MVENTKEGKARAELRTQMVTMVRVIILVLIFLDGLDISKYLDMIGINEFSIGVVGF